jgi:alpha-glucosidase
MAPAGAIIPTTHCKGDYSRRHDEPSRSLRLFPGERSGRSRAILYEDDGISADGPLTEVTIALGWTPTEIRLSATAHGDYALPYRDIHIILPEQENRILKIESRENPGDAMSNVKLVR